MSHDESLREHLRALLAEAHAHVDFNRAIDGLPVEARGARHPSVPHTPWRLVEHLRIAQWDILAGHLIPVREATEAGWHRSRSMRFDYFLPSTGLSALSI